MEAYQKRVIDEKAELDKKMDALTTFIDSKHFSELSPYEQDILVQQLHHMGNYTAVLAERISWFVRCHAK